MVHPEISWLLPSGCTVLASRCFFSKKRGTPGSGEIFTNSIGTPGTVLATTMVDIGPNIVVKTRKKADAVWCYI